MKNTFFCPLPSVRLFAAVATLCVALYCLSFFSCSANDDSGSLSIVMPSSSPSRSITSENPGGMGLPAGASVDGYVFSVYIRDSNNDEVEKYTGVRPGATLTIDQLRAGKYNIAIRCISLASNIVGFYGTAQADVKGGTENTASVKLAFCTGASCEIHFASSLDSLTDVGDNRIEARATCKNGDSYSILSDYNPTSLTSVEAGKIYDVGPLYFFEPGFTYTLDVTISDTTTGGVLYHVKKSATSTLDGIYFYVD